MCLLFFCFFMYRMIRRCHPLMPRVSGLLTSSRVSKRPQPFTRHVEGEKLSCQMKGRCMVSHLTIFAKFGGRIFHKVALVFFCTISFIWDFHMSHQNLLENLLDVWNPDTLVISGWHLLIKPIQKNERIIDTLTTIFMYSLKTII